MDKTSLSPETRIALLELQMSELKQAQADIKQHLTHQDRVLNRFMGALILLNIAMPFIIQFITGKH